MILYLYLFLKQFLASEHCHYTEAKKWLVCGLVKFVTAVARLVCLNLLGSAYHILQTIFFSPVVNFLLSH